jgi:hypothetical protein
MYLVADMKTKCYESVHRFWLLETGLPLSMYAAGFPLFAFIFLYGKRKMIK